MKSIALTQNKSTEVDSADYKTLNQYKWHVMQINGKWYAARAAWNKKTKKKRIILMHRVISNNNTKLPTDHINGDTLDNRSSNLRICTNRVNAGNRKGKTTGKYTSKHVGVSLHKPNGKWRAAIKVEGRAYHLGYFVCELEAAQAYRDALLDIS